MRAGMHACGIDKGGEASVNLMCRGRSTHELLDSPSGPEPCPVCQKLWSDTGGTNVMAEVGPVARGKGCTSLAGVEGTRVQQELSEVYLSRFLDTLRLGLSHAINCHICWFFLSSHATAPNVPHISSTAFCSGPLSSLLPLVFGPTI